MLLHNICNLSLLHAYIIIMKYKERGAFYARTCLSAWYS